MRKYGLAAIACAAVLAAGCSSGGTNTTISELGIGTMPPEPETTAARTERSGEDLLDSANRTDDIESLEARIESIESVLESYKAMEESREAAAMESASAASEAETSAIPGQTGTVPYSDLVDFADNYAGTVVTYTGRVIQAVSLNDTTMQLLMAVDSDDALKLVGEYQSSLIPYGLNHGDIVTMTGVYSGVMRYLVGAETRIELPTVKIQSLTREYAAETSAEQEQSAEETAESGTSASGPGQQTSPGPGASSGPGTSADTSTSGSSDGPSGPGASSGPGSSGPGVSSGPGSSGPGRPSGSD